MGSEKGRGDGEGRTVTFLGRGLALRSPTRLTLLVCPLCSQRNGERTAALGTCVWCGYEPAERDEVPCEPDEPTRRGAATKALDEAFRPDRSVYSLTNDNVCGSLRPGQPIALHEGRIRLNQEPGTRGGPQQDRRPRKG